MNNDPEINIKRSNSRCLRQTAALLMVLIAALLTACGGKNDKALYVITAEGSPGESGVIEYAGLTMNVYADEASNPCGDCPDQPVSICAGAGPDQVVKAMAEGVSDADDMWQVLDSDGSMLILEEKVAGSVKDAPVLDAPEGLDLRGKFYAIGTLNRDDSLLQISSGQEITKAGSPAGDEQLEEGMKQIVNLDGNAVSVYESAPERVAAIYGPAYEALVVLGAEDRIVVCSDVQFENFPWARKIFPRINELPHLDNVHSSVSGEELKKYDPQLALTFNRPNELKQLKALGIPAVYGVTSESLDNVKEQLKVYAQALGGDAPERAEKYADYFDRKLKKITDVTVKLNDKDRPDVYYSGIDILTTYGNRSDICEVIRAAGGNPVMSELDAGNHTQIDFEQLAAWNPEYIFIDHGGMNDRNSVEEISRSTGSSARYGAVKAVKNGNVYLTPSGVFYWDMGLQKILLTEYMAEILHPDLFGDLDMNGEVREFYSTFFNYELTEREAEQILNREDPS
ncbi:MAG: ABC transporter substrate-binding protein [Clostridia bacterium]|nr:ABC transporter substrate-binding protein [Clostridia bacterium]